MWFFTGLTCQIVRYGEEKVRGWKVLSTPQSWEQYRASSHEKLNYGSSSTNSKKYIAACTSQSWSTVPDIRPSQRPVFSTVVSRTHSKQAPERLFTPGEISRYVSQKSPRCGQPRQSVEIGTKTPQSRPCHQSPYETLHGHIQTKHASLGKYQSTQD